MGRLIGGGEIRCGDVRLALARGVAKKIDALVSISRQLVRGATLVEATVIASASQRGDVVLTSDVDDLHRIAARFPSVRVLGV